MRQMGRTGQMGRMGRMGRVHRTACAATLVGIALATSFVPGHAQRRDPFDVEARQYLGTPQSEAAVQKGLNFLASRVQPDGHWNSSHYNADAAVTGLAVLAFLSAGHQPGRGRYGTFLNRATDWLADSTQRSGLIFRGGSAGPPMYGHGFATLALAELYGMSRRADLRTKLEDAVRLIGQTQNAEGGWRYQPQAADADISVTVVQVLALRAAANAGIKVPAETIRKAVGYLKRCQNNSDGGFSYQTNQRSSGPARTGAAVLCLYLTGDADSKECKNGITYLLQHPITKYEWAYREHYFYALYYCTQAFYQVGGKPWAEWYRVIRERLIATQEKDGHWRDNPGDEYATAMAVLCLQVPAGLLPIYQRL